MDNRQRECFEKAYDTAAELILKATDEFTEMFPGSASVNNFYQPVKMTDWTEGFWTGEVWLAYEKTGNEKLKKTAETEVENFMRRIKDRIVVDHHDMGFLFSPSCVAAYKLTGNETGKEAALMAADNLLGRFQEKGQFVQAWGELGAEDNYRLIIDCLLNMPLLFWAGEVTGDPKYAEKAQAHIKTAMKCIIREDNSTYHTYFFDKNTGEPLRGVTHQGYRDGSAWARGQAWGVYGSALAYKFLRDEEYVDIFCRLTDYFLEHLPENKIPYWDFDFTDGSDEPRDSSAAAIAVCGMLEMSKYLPEEKAQYYTQKAEELTEALIRECAVTDPAVSNGLLLHGTYAKGSPYNTCKDNGVDECVAWGDYFYMEALTRLMKDWEPYWYIVKNNIFIEGLPGYGKSTLLNRLARTWPEYQVYREGDLSPAELAWCSYLTGEDWEEMLRKYPAIQEEIREKTKVEDGRYIVAYTRILAEDRAFYQDMEQHEIYNGRVDFKTFQEIIMKRYRGLCGRGNLFECSFFQNSIESMMLFYEMGEDDILAFYEEAYGILREKGFKLIYLDSDRIRENLLHIKRERSDENGNEMWFPLMLNFLKESPYGKAHGYQDMEDVIAHFERRRRLELRILREIIRKDGLILEAKGFAADTVPDCCLHIR